MWQRISIVWLMLAVAVLGSAGPADAYASDESSTVAKINAERTARGMNTLEVYWDLTDDARAWTAAMINDGSISHNPNLGSVTSGWEALAENVGVGPNVDRLHTAFMDSAGHKANILGDYNYVGVGADRAPDGNLYITVVFMRGPAGLVSPPTTTTTVTPTTTTTTVAPTTTTTTTPPATTTTTTVTPTTTTPTTSTTKPAATKPPATTTTTHPPTAAAPVPTPFEVSPSTVTSGGSSPVHRCVHPDAGEHGIPPTGGLFCVN